MSSLRRGLLATVLAALGLSACPVAVPAAQQLRFACGPAQPCPDGQRCQAGYCQAVSFSDAGGLEGGGQDGTVADQAFVPDGQGIDAVQSDRGLVDQPQLDSPTRDSIVADSSPNDIAINDAAIDDAAIDDAAPPCVNFALAFAALQSSVAVADPPNLQGTEGLTVEAWIFPDATDLLPGHRALIISHEDPANDDGYSLLIRDGWLEFRLRDHTFDDQGISAAHSVWGAYDPARKLQVGVWQHVAGTYDGLALRLFVDGRLQVQDSSAQPSLTHASLPLQIGAAPAQTGGYFSGLIDALRLSDRALYVADFVRPTQAFAAQASTVALWQLDEGVGFAAADSSGAAHEGLLGCDGTASSCEPDALSASWQRVSCVEARGPAVFVDAGSADSGLPSCDDTFGEAAGYELCEETAASCEFSVNLSSSTCTALCASYGASCINAFDNASIPCDRRPQLGDD